MSELFLNSKEICELKKLTDSVNKDFIFEPSEEIQSCSCTGPAHSCIYH